MRVVESIGFQRFRMGMELIMPSMELWAIMAGEKVKALAWTRGNALKKMPSAKEEAPPWVEVRLERLEVNGDSRALVDYVVGKIWQGVEAG